MKAASSRFLKFNLFDRSKVESGYREMKERTFDWIKRYQPLLVLGSIAVAVISYFYVVGAYSSNIPNSDDFEAVLDLVNRFDTATTSEKLYLLLRNHMEHRIVFCRLIVLLDYSIFGKVNFVHLIILGNLSMIGLLWLFYQMLPDVENRILYLIPVTFLFLNLQQYENAIWAMGSLQNLWVIFFSLLCLYLLNKESFSFLIGAVVAGVMASYTSGSGLFALLAGVALLVLGKRSPVHILIWLTATALIFYTYFLNYVPPNPDFKMMDAVLHSPDKIIADFFAMAGGGLTFEKYYQPQFNTIGFIVAMSGGYAISVFFLHLIREKYFFRNPHYFSLVLFFFIAFLSVSVSRMSFGAEYIADTGRYKINSVTFYVILYLIVIDLYFRKVRVIPFLLMTTFAVFYWALAYWANISTISAVKTQLQRSSNLIYQQHSYAGLVHWEPEGLAARILKSSTEKGTYVMPEIPNAVPLSLETKLDSGGLPEAGDQVVCAFDVLYDEKSGSFIIGHGWAFAKNQNADGNKILVVLKSDTEVKVFETDREDRKDVTAFFKDQEGNESGKSFDLDESGFNFSINKQMLENKRYQVGILIETNEGARLLHYPGKTIDNVN